MKGNIYTREKCRICGGIMSHIETKNGCYCRKHPKEQATGKFFVRFGKDLYKTFKTYTEASRYLNGLRYETDQGTFDIRDHQSNNPLGFSNLADQYLNFKKKQNLVSFYYI